MYNNYCSATIESANSCYIFKKCAMPLTALLLAQPLDSQSIIPQTIKERIIIITKKKKCIIALVLVLAVAIPIGLYVAGNLYYSAKRIYEQNWNIELPDKMKVKFDIKDGNSSHNDGVRYTVFEVKERSEFFNDFSSKKSPAFEEHFQENISGLKLSDENLPNWNDNYIWKQMELYENSLYIVFDTDTDTLFITQKTQ